MTKAIPNPADPIRDRRHIKLIKEILKSRSKGEQLLLFTIGINSGLRVGDLLQLTYGTLWKKDGTPRKEFAKRSQKTGSFGVTKINKPILEAMQVAHGKTDVTSNLTRLLFPRDRRTVTRWVKRWCHDVGLDEGNYSAHSLRKTFAYQLWVEQGKTDEGLIIVSKALGHKNTGTTMDYLGIRREQVSKWQAEMEL